MNHEMKPILSIITINRNNAKGLERTINSVISQRFKDYEWIVIDGASTDDSVDVIKRFAEHFAYWVSENDTGVYNAMNKGIKQAHGKYLQFLNSGDWLYDEYVYEMVFGTPRDKDIFWGYTIMFGQNGGQYYFGQKSTEFSAFSMMGAMSHPSSFIKRELFDKYGLYDETYRRSADSKFFFNAIVIHECSLEVIDKPIAYFEGGGISDEIEKGKPECIRILETYLPPRVVKDFYIRQEKDACIAKYFKSFKEMEILQEHVWSRFIIKCMLRFLH